MPSSGWRWPTGTTATGGSPRCCGARAGRQPQARAAADARGQSAVSATAAVRAGDDGLAPCAGGSAEPGARHAANRPGPALGRRHHLRPAAEEFAYLAVVLDAFSRRVIGWAMADHLRPSLALAALTMALAGATAAPAAWSITPTAACSTPAATTPGAWWRPRHPAQHEPGRLSLRQRQGRELHEDLKTRGGRRHAAIAISPTRRPRSAPSSSRSTTASDCTRLSPIVAGRVRSRLDGPGAAAQRPPVRSTRPVPDFPVSLRGCSPVGPSRIGSGCRPGVARISLSSIGAADVAKDLEAHVQHGSCSSSFDPRRIRCCWTVSWSTNR